MELVRSLLPLVGLGFLLAAQLVIRRANPVEPKPREIGPQRPGPFAWPKPDRRPPPGARMTTPRRAKLLLGCSAVCLAASGVLILQETTSLLW